MAEPLSPPKPASLTVLHNLLVIALYGIGLSLGLGRGLYWWFLYGCAGASLGLLIFDHGWRRLNPPASMFLLLAAAFYLHGQWAADGGFESQFSRYLLWGTVPAIGTLLVSQRDWSRDRWNHPASIAVLAAVCSGIQGLAYLFGSNRFGLFSNSHYLAFFASLSLPLLWLGWIEIRHRARWLLLPFMVLDLYLLVKTGSRPGYLALLAGSAVILPFLSGPAALRAALALVLIPAALYGFGLFGFDERVDDLVGNLRRDERTTLWSEAGQMQLDSTPRQWILGHGFGSFRRDYSGYSTFNNDDERFHYPHNFFMELLYSHGMIGLTLAAGAYLGFVLQLIVAVRNAAEGARRRLGMLLISLIAIHFVHSFLTLPLFSRYSFLPFGLILGASFVYLREAAARGNH